MDYVGFNVYNSLYKGLVTTPHCTYFSVDWNCTLCIIHLLLVKLVAGIYNFNSILCIWQSNLSGHCSTMELVMREPSSLQAQKFGTLAPNTVLSLCLT